MVRAESIEYKDLVDLYPKRRGELIGASFELLQSRVNYFNACGPAYTFKYGDNVIGIGGVLIIHPGVGQIWLCMSDDVNSCYFSFTKLCRKMLDEMKLHRIQCDVTVEQPNWINWCKYLGFKQEGIMKKYYPNGVDAVMLARVN